MDYSKLRSTTVYLTIVQTLQCLAPAVTQVVDECLPRCWNLKENLGVGNAERREEVTSEVGCKELCLNTENCIGLDWDKRQEGSCWFQMGPLNSYNQTNINHWSLTDCTHECSSYCWKAVQIGLKVSGINSEADIVNENDCKLRCSGRSDCNGVDWWNSRCYLITNGQTARNQSESRHWEIVRNLQTNCLSNATSSTVYRSTSDFLNPLLSTTSLSEYMSSSTESLGEGTAGNSYSLTTGIIVLAVFLGLCIVTIIGLAINTVRIEKQLNLKSDVKCAASSDNNYEGLQKAVTTQRIEDGTYTDLVQGSRNEIVSENSG